ncbi:helix-turn-helix protein [Rhizobium sp. PP-CC-2G-626]|nr:helix-turn-helix protein [Rhizobium sp. PP-CC-2G-626]
MTDWPKLVRELQVEMKLSERQLALLVGANRTTLRQFFLGKHNISIIMLERILVLCGYELEAVQIDPAVGRPLRKKRRIHIPARNSLSIIEEPKPEPRRKSRKNAVEGAKPQKLISPACMRHGAP